MQKLISSKKSLLLVLFSFLLIIALVANITTALFFSSSSTYSVVVISDLDISSQFLNQSGGALNITTQTLLPGERIPRTLQINNAVGSQDAYVRIQGIFEIDRGSGFEQSLDVQMQLKSTQANWTQGQSGPEFWFYYNLVLAPNQTITVDLEFVVFPTAGNDEYGLSNDDAGKPYKVTVTVNAVQTANNAYSAWSPDYPVGWPS